MGRSKHTNCWFRRGKLAWNPDMVPYRQNWPASKGVKKSHSYRPEAVIIGEMEMPASKKSAVAAGATPKKAAVVKSKKPRVKPTHPSTAEMVNTAIKALKERRGSSVQAIKKYAVETYKIDAEKQGTYIKKYLKAAVASGVIIQTKGKGATGSFKIASGKLETSKPKPKPAGNTKALKKKVTGVKELTAVKTLTTTIETKKASIKKAASAAIKGKINTVSKGLAAKHLKTKTTTKTKSAAKTSVKEKLTAPKKRQSAVTKPKKATPKVTTA